MSYQCRCKNPQQNINQIQEHKERIIHQDQVDLILEMQGWFITQKLINIIHHINRIKGQNPHDNVNRGVRNTFDKIQNICCKNIQQTRIRRENSSTR